MRRSLRSAPRGCPRASGVRHAGARILLLRQPARPGAEPRARRASRDRRIARADAGSDVPGAGGGRRPRRGRRVRGAPALRLAIGSTSRTCVVASRTTAPSRWCCRRVRSTRSRRSPSPTIRRTRAGLTSSTCGPNRPGAPAHRGRARGVGRRVHGEAERHPADRPPSGAAPRGTLNAESPPLGGLSAIRRSGGFRGKGTFS